MILFGISALTVGLGFLLHELAHKYMAERYRFSERFIADDRMLVIMIIISFFGFVFAAPGGVYIQGHLSTEKHGKVALAGPLTNLILALFFLPMQMSGEGIVAMIGGYGFFINCWLASNPYHNIFLLLQDYLIQHLNLA